MRLALLIAGALLVAGVPAWAGGGYRACNDEGMRHLAAGRYAAARKSFDEAIALSPGTAHLYNNAAAACMNLGLNEEARHYLARCLILDPGNVKALSNMAITSFRLFRFADAYRYYRLARDADPYYAGGRFARERVRLQVATLAAEHPERDELAKLLRYLER